MMDNISLKPCPFCGGDAERVNNGPSSQQVSNALSWGQDVDDGGSFIRCTKCDASTAVHYDRRENLVSSWNDRKGETPEPLPEDVEALARKIMVGAGVDDPGACRVVAREWLADRQRAVKAEREACAQCCDDYGEGRNPLEPNDGLFHGDCHHGPVMAKIIRARGAAQEKK